ncbi:MAG: hypothetical protein ACK5T6_02050, partial [Pirellula sp.]
IKGQVGVVNGVPIISLLSHLGRKTAPDFPELDVFMRRLAARGNISPRAEGVLLNRSKNKR